MTTLSSNLQNILDSRLRYLPEITGRAINSIDWSGKLIAIGHKFGLHVDEMEEFQGVVLKSMIGLVPPEKFESELINALALSPASMDEVIAEINNQIFEPIHEFVMNNGKVDPIKNTGLVLETPAEEVAQTVSKQIPISSSSDMLEIPASPEPDEKEEDFDDYFEDPSVIQ